MFGDGRSTVEVQQVLSPAAQQVLNVGGPSLVKFIVKIDPNAYYAIERFTDASGKSVASTSGLRWITDMGGKVVSQTGSTVTITLPANKLAELASLPMFLYFDTESAGTAAVIPSSAIVSPATGIMTFLKREQWGLPMWSWLAIAGGLTVILIGIRKRRTSI